MTATVVVKNQTASDSEPAIEFSGIVKRYPGVVALKNVTMTVRRGEVHAIVGENGAGKSTLMAIASGVETADEGTISVAGRQLAGGSPREALDHGVSVVYQHASITPDLTVEENVFLGVPAHLRPRRGGVTKWAREQLAMTGSRVDPRDRVSTLSPADRQLVEITKAAASQSRILVLDEPTESLTAQETERLFAHVRSVTAQGSTVIYISHRLGDVKAISDRLTVLRDGETRGTFVTADVSEHQILELIVGGDVSHAFPPKADPKTLNDTVLEVRGFSTGRARDIDFSARAGEILGLAGIDGNGQQDVVRGLAGLQASSGRATLRGANLDLSTPARSMGSGLAHLPEDRHAGGLFLPLTVRENLTALSLPKVSRHGFIGREREREAARADIAAFGIRTSSEEATVQSLSGGNQQKILFSRALGLGGEVLLAAEPTRGVDVGARLEIYESMRTLSAAGKSVVVLSSDAMELAGLCDRVVVFSRGRVVAVLAAEEVTEEAITGAALSARVQRDGSRTDATRSRGGRWARFRGGDYFPALLVALLCLAFVAFTTTRNGLFLGDRNVSGTLLLLIPLALASFAQLIVVMSGGFDLSVGSVMSMTAAILSYYAQDGQNNITLLVGIAVCAGAAAVVGAANAAMIVWAKFSPVLATLVTFILVQGVALLVRATPDGLIRFDISETLSKTLGPVPVAVIGCVGLVLVGEWLLRFSSGGITLRAVGSDPARARRLGANVPRTILGAYLASALLAGVAGIMLYSVIGVGDATSGVSYLLLSISAVVLGGASIHGGSGSFVGTFLGALLIVVVVSSATFLQLGMAWQSLLPGLMIVFGAALYSRARPGVADRRTAL